MTNISNQNLIVADPAICHGKPTFRGTRVMVWQILELLEVGETHEQIYAAYPTLSEGAIEALKKFNPNTLDEIITDARLEYSTGATRGFRNPKKLIQFLNHN